MHLVTAARNALHSFLAPWPGLSGPVFTAAHATIVERYAMGKKSMESIYSGGGTFWISGLIALFMLPLVTFFKPVLPIALSLTLILTAYICILVGMEQLKNSTERGVAGIVAITLAMPDPKSTIYAVVIGFVLYFLLERPRLLGKHDNSENILGFFEQKRKDENQRNTFLFNIGSDFYLNENNTITASFLTCGAFSGITIFAFTPKFLAAKETACAKLPEECVTTPLSCCASLN